MTEMEIMERAIHELAALKTKTGYNLASCLCFLQALCVTDPVAMRNAATLLELESSAALERAGKR